MFTFKINNTYWSRLGLDHIIAIAILSSSLSKYCWCCWNTSLNFYHVSSFCWNHMLMFGESYQSYQSSPYDHMVFAASHLFFNPPGSNFFSYRKSDEISKVPPCLDPCRGYSRGRAIRGHRRYSQRGSLAGDPWSNPDSGGSGRSCRDYCNILNIYIYCYIIYILYI